MGSDQVTDGSGGTACIQISHLLPQMGGGRTEQALRPSEGASALLVEFRAAHASPLLWSLTLLFWAPGVVGFVSIFFCKTTASATRMVVPCSCFKIESVDVTGEGGGMDQNGSVAEN
jgi:hypothetical protein